MNKVWMDMDRILLYFQNYLIVYVFIICTIYLILFLMAYVRLRKERGLHHIEPYMALKQSAFTPPLSILVPAYNEEKGIVPSLLSLLTGNGRLDYPEFEIIVINDGSKDLTLETVIQRFKMKVLESKVLVKRNGIDTQPVRAVYQSELYENLFLIDKYNGGKADALNAGINFCRYPYFASIDGDTVLETDSFLKIMKPIIENSGQEILATGGNVLIANGSRIVQGRMQEMRLSQKPLVVMQTIEYMRAFLMGRIGLSGGNLLLLISGAFGVFNTSKVIQAGGYRTNTIGEDMELVVRLQRFNMERQWGGRIIYVADPVCYTEAPEQLRALKNQRVRWHRGLFESLWQHRRMMFNPRYGMIGMAAMPYFLIVELLGPLIEFMGYVSVVVGLYKGSLHYATSFSLFAVMVVYGSLLSMGAVLLEEWRLGKYRRLGELNRLFIYALTDSFWYRPLMTIWRVWSLVKVILGRKQSWGEQKRVGVSS